ncbi:MAG: LVIVD repeat-containing protein [Gaiellaceae bacterium]
MPRAPRVLVLGAFVCGLLTFPLAAGAGHTTDPAVNLAPLGHIQEPAVLGGFGGANPDINTDIAFWGRYAYQGNWDGFSIRDIKNPNNPTTVSRTFCDGNQGDVAVWNHILVRSWNTPAGSPGPFGAGLTCDGEAVPAGWEGVHVFDIGDKKNPELIASVRTQCGSHTATLVPDKKNGRVIVYSNVSSGCNFIDIIEIPLDDPSSAHWIGSEPLEHPCHDMGVILGDVNKAACAGGDGFDLFSLGAPDGGSLENPLHLRHVMVPTVSIGHSAAFSWDGEIVVFGHEPGGGVAAECEATDPPLNRSFFFYDTDTGMLLGTWTLPRAQGPTENCTLHNYNVIPTKKRNLLVSGAYQAGTWVVDFTNPAAAFTVAWSDPPPKPVPPGTIFCCDVTGAWSTYWYNRELYESNIGEGLNIFKPLFQQVGATNLKHLNPQTQEFSLD